MKMSTVRLGSFSDGVIAIIITIMVLEIPLPATITTESISEFLMLIAIYFVSFMVVGAQWNRHHVLFNNFQEVSQQIFWRNLLYLFFLSLIPIFTKWIMQNPDELIPAFGYSLVYILTILSFYFMKLELIKDNPDNEFIKSVQAFREKQIGSRGSKNADFAHFRLVILVMIIVLIGVGIFSYYHPKIGELLFIVFPVGSSLFNMRSDGIESRIRAKQAQ